MTKRSITMQAVETYRVNLQSDDDWIEVTFTVEHKGDLAAGYASIERVIDGEVTETWAIANAETLHAALGEAIEAAKRAVDEWIAEVAKGTVTEHTATDPKAIYFKVYGRKRGRRHRENKVEEIREWLVNDDIDRSGLDIDQLALEWIEDEALSRDWGVDDD